MNDEPSGTTLAPPSGVGPAASADRGHLARNVATVIAAFMVVLAMVGTGVALSDATWARKYWLFLVPTYGLLCIFVAWYRNGVFDRSVARQILHWLAVGIAIVMDFTFLQGSGEQTATATGLSSLLILALGCLLAGVHLDWLFALVGLVLLVIVVVVSMAQEYMMLVFLLGTLIVIVIFGAQWLARRWFPDRDDRTASRP